MDTGWNDRQREEWIKLRQLRFVQVRNQAKVVAQDVLRRAQERRESRKLRLMAQKEKALSQWKKVKIMELEQAYEEAVQDIGEANRLAHSQPEAEEVLNRLKVKNDEIAKGRGKMAGLRFEEERRALSEKENAPFRRKQMTRNIEDIRAGLVVQCRDASTIKQASHQVLLDIPVINVQDFEPRQPVLSWNREESKSTMTSSRFKEPIEPVPKARDVPKNTWRNANMDVPGFEKPLEMEQPKERLNIADHNPIAETTREAGLKPLEFEEQNEPQKSTRSSVVVERTGKMAADPNLVQSQRMNTVELSPITKFLLSNRPEFNQISVNQQPFISRPQITSDNEIDAILQRYQKPQVSTRRQPKPSIAKPRVTKKSEASKLLEVINKGLEEGRQLQKEVSDRRRIARARHNRSNSSSSSDSYTDEEVDKEDSTVLKLIVQVNCPNAVAPPELNKQDMKNRSTSIGESLLESDTQRKPSRVSREEKLKKKDMSTSVGESLVNSNAESDTKRKRINNVNMEELKKKDMSTSVGESLLYSNSECETQRDLSRKEQLKKNDMSTSIGKSLLNEESEPECVCNIPSVIEVIREQPDDDSSTDSECGCCLRRSSTMTDLSSDPQVFPRTFNTSSILQETPSSRSSRTSYLSLPQPDLSQNASGVVLNPVLEHYIRELLNLPPQFSSDSTLTNSSATAKSNRSTDPHLTEVKPDFQSESEQRQRRIDELHQMLQRLENMTYPSISRSSSSDNSPTEATNQQRPQVAQEETAAAHRLSTIVELSGHDSTSSLPDIMADLLRKNIITSPFTWSEGASLSSDSSQDGDEK